MEEQQSGQQLKQEPDDVHFLSQTRTPTGGLQKKNQFQSTLPGPKWQSVLAQDQYD
jgi:hypothetical protein